MIIVIIGPAKKNEFQMFKTFVTFSKHVQLKFFSPQPTERHRSFASATGPQSLSRKWRRGPSWRERKRFRSRGALWKGLAGWWFGTWISWLSIIYGIIWDNPSHWRTHIFQDGWNHQPGYCISSFQPEKVGKWWENDGKMKNMMRHPL